MKFKEGVITRGVKDEIWQALVIADHIYYSFGKELVVTSLNDSHEHKPKSLHNKGLAADLRTNYFNKAIAMRVFSELKQALEKQYPKCYDVILESNHIHLEWDPK